MADIHIVCGEYSTGPSVPLQAYRDRDTAWEAKEMLIAHRDDVRDSPLSKSDLPVPDGFEDIRTDSGSIIHEYDFYTLSTAKLADEGPES